MTLATENIEEKNNCCGGPATENIDACCVQDADAKASGEEGCGCNTQQKPEPKTSNVCCG